MPTPTHRTQNDWLYPTSIQRKLHNLALIEQEDGALYSYLARIKVDGPDKAETTKLQQLAAAHYHAARLTMGVDER